MHHQCGTLLEMLALHDRATENGLVTKKLLEIHAFLTLKYGYRETITGIRKKFLMTDIWT